MTGPFDPEKIDNSSQDAFGSLDSIAGVTSAPTIDTTGPCVNEWMHGSYGFDTGTICSSQEKTAEPFQTGQAQPVIYVDKSERSLIVEWYEGQVRREQRISYKKYGNAKAKQRANDLVAKVKAGYTFDQLYPEKGPPVVAIYENVGKFQVSLIRDRYLREWRVEWVNNCGTKMRARWSCKKIGNDEARSRAEMLADSLKQGVFAPRLLHKATGTRLSRCELRADLRYDASYSNVFGTARKHTMEALCSDKKTKPVQAPKRKRRKSVGDTNFTPLPTARVDSVHNYHVYAACNPFQSFPTFQAYQEIQPPTENEGEEKGEEIGSSVYGHPQYFHDYQGNVDFYKEGETVPPVGPGTGYYDPYGVYNYYQYVPQFQYPYAVTYGQDPYQVTRLCSTEQDAAFITEKPTVDEPDISQEARDMNKWVGENDGSGFPFASGSSKSEYGAMIQNDPALYWNSKSQDTFGSVDTVCEYPAV